MTKLFFFSYIPKSTKFQFFRLPISYKSRSCGQRVLELYRRDPFTFFSCFATFMVAHLLVISVER